MKKTIITILLFLSFTNTAVADDISTSDPVKRFGIEAGLGTNIFLPYAKAQLSYILPVNQNRLGIFFDQSANAGFAPLLHISTLGAKYYFSENKINQPLLNSNFFVSLAGGLGYNLGERQMGINLSPGPNIVYPLVISAGIGDEINIMNNLALNIGVYTGYPIWLHNELNLKIKF